MKKKLPKFERGKIYVIKGETANDIIAAMIQEVTANPRYIKITKKPDGIVEISLAAAIPAPPSDGDYVLTSQDGSIEWEAIGDC